MTFHRQFYQDPTPTAGPSYHRSFYKLNPAISDVSSLSSFSSGSSRKTPSTRVSSLPSSRSSIASSMTFQSGSSSSVPSYHTGRTSSAQPPSVSSVRSAIVPPVGLSYDQVRSQTIAKRMSSPSVTSVSSTSPSIVPSVTGPKSMLINGLKGAGLSSLPAIGAHGLYLARNNAMEDDVAEKRTRYAGVGVSAAIDNYAAHKRSDFARTSLMTTAGGTLGTFFGPIGTAVGSLAGLAAGKIIETTTKPHLQTAFDREGPIAPISTK